MKVASQSQRHIVLICAVVCCASIYLSSQHIQLPLHWTGIALLFGVLWHMLHLYCVVKLRCTLTLLLMLHLIISVVITSIPLIQGAIFSFQHTVYLLLQYFAFIGIGQLFVRLQWLKKQHQER